VTDTPSGTAPPGAAPAGTRCGFVAVLGAPNVGKSTLVNRLVGSKVTIVSPKVQTTRTRVLGIVVRDRTQIVWVDTPGIFAPRRRFERAMVRTAWQGAGDADLVLLVVDAERGRDRDTDRIIEGMAKAGRTAILALNKIDLVRPERLLPLAASLQGTGLFTDVFMISAATGDGVDDLADSVAARLPEGPWLYPEDQLTDLPMRLLAAEITREQAFLQLSEELPYAIAVETETWEPFSDGSVRIGQAIFVERAGQKAIVLGKGGARIKTIGARARKELEAMLGHRVHLVLFVKERPGWQNDREVYAIQGMDWSDDDR